MTGSSSIPQDGAAGDIAASLPGLADLINGRVGAWHDYGVPLSRKLSNPPVKNNPPEGQVLTPDFDSADPPAPDHASIPPLGERSAEAIRNGHQAVRDIDEMIRQLHALRGQLVSELRQDEDLRAVRTDAMLAGRESGGAL